MATFSEPGSVSLDRSSDRLWESLQLYTHLTAIAVTVNTPLQVTITLRRIVMHTQNAYRRRARVVSGLVSCFAMGNVSHSVGGHCARSPIQCERIHFEIASV
ncbi:hypothetical protein BaRGS_00035269 [Batillaria attramentaria]|uniref:Uncharacterized protein n=1 Tax=Batillaria attramentaria TaxID=370345 RepID=A0ABD0JEZ9_9CAEN